MTVWPGDQPGSRSIWGGRSAWPVRFDSICALDWYRSRLTWRRAQRDHDSAEALRLPVGRQETFASRSALAAKRCVRFRCIAARRQGLLRLPGTPELTCGAISWLLS